MEKNVHLLSLMCVSLSVTCFGCLIQGDILFLSYQRNNKLVWDEAIKSHSRNNFAGMGLLIIAMIFLLILHLIFPFL